MQHTKQDSAKPQALVIGAGVGGLAAACRLAHKGYAVEVYEAQEHPGGKLSEIRLGDYRFDAGPSLCTLPHLIQEVFADTGRRAEDYLQFVPLEEACRYWWPDGASLTAWLDNQRFAREVAEKLGVPAQRVQSYLDKSRRLYQGPGRLFTEQPLHRARTWLSASALRAGAQVGWRQLLGSLHGANRAALGDARLVQLFDRFATYNGSDPYQAPGMLQLIPHLEQTIGPVFPQGGMVQITNSLYRLAQELGVRFHFGAPIQRLEVSGKRVSTVHAAGKRLAPALVVSNLDIHTLYTRLLPQRWAPQRSLRQERSSSALIFYWGVQRQFPQLGLHNIFFSADYQREFQEIFRQHSVPQEPTVYVNISSRHSPADAPAGCESWFVLINTPAKPSEVTPQVVDRCRQWVGRLLTPHLGQDPTDYIQVEDTLTPARLQQRDGSHLGALYGASSNSRWAAFLRHRNQHTRLRNLFLCGGSVHPGGGIPLCLLSARLVSQLAPTPQS